MHMEIRILQLKEGAAQAEGLTVIIDVFRAFSLEACMLAQGMECIYPVADLETAYALKKEHPDYILAGERKGAILPGFDYGNSPSSVQGIDFSGRRAVHTTSAGTQGIRTAVHAQELLGGSLLTAAATAAYIKTRNPDIVSLVCMGWEGVRPTEEDTLCAEYIRSLLIGEPMSDIEEKAQALRYTEGRKFFDPAQQAVFPEADFHISVQHDVFPFAVRITQQDGLYKSEAVYTGMPE